MDNKAKWDDVHSLCSDCGEFMTEPERVICCTCNDWGEAWPCDPIQWHMMQQSLKHGVVFVCALCADLFPDYDDEVLPVHKRYLCPGCR